jgi:hypothetical protein
MMSANEAEVTVMSSGTDPATPPPSSDRNLSVEELARLQGVRPIGTVDELARDDVFETDEELDEFLEFITATRHRDVI